MKLSKINPQILIIIVFSILGQSIPYAQNISLVSRYGTPLQLTTTIEVSGNYAYLGGQSGDLVIIDISNPGNPVQVGRCYVSSGEVELLVSGNYAYLAGNTNFWVVDVTDPYHPRIIGGISADVISDMVISGDYIYWASYNSGLRIFSIAEPSNPIFIGCSDSIGDVRGIDVFDARAYLVGGSFGLKIIDINDPMNPVIIAGSPLMGYAQKVSVLGNYAYIVNGTNLQVVRISNPENIITTGRTDIDAWQVEVTSDYACVADQDSGIQIVNITDPNHIFWAGRYRNASRARNLRIYGDYIYVAAEYYFFMLRITSTGIKEVGGIPIDFSLSPNYPNPFNSSTTIRYNLPTESPVTIDIYDILGRKVQTLLDVKAQAGPNQVNWNAAGLPSGAYFARLKAGEQSQTMKMILMK